jgi:CPA1 family monovalent cation:H+ antiporter
MNTQEVIGVLLPLTAICCYINYRYIKLPKSIGITLVALSITLIITLSNLIGPQINDMAQNLVDKIGFNETFLNGMLSFLLFAGSLHINTLEMSKYKLIISIFATVSVLISTIIIGYGTYLITQYLSINLPFYYCFVFGALISPTDAITVIEVLKTIDVPKSLEMKISGEALFNDGMGIVLFFMALALATGEQKAIDPSEALIYFMREGGGGLLCGAIMGFVAAKLLSTIDDYELAIILTLALVTGGYALVTSVLNVSGPICMAVTGLIIGSFLKRDSKCKETMVRVEVFWDLLDQVLNAILFVLIGLEFLRIDFDLPITIASIGVILLSIVARWVSVSAPVACMTHYKNFNPAVLAIMTWGGLRGGISIALALSITGPYRDIIVSITYSVVLFSIMVQGLTMRGLITRMSRHRALA